MLAFYIGTTLVSNVTFAIYFNKFMKRLTDEGYIFKNKESFNKYFSLFGILGIIPIVNFIVGARVIKEEENLYSLLKEDLIKSHSIKKSNIDNKNINNLINNIKKQIKDDKVIDMTLEERKEYLNKLKNELISEDDDTLDKPKTKTKKK